MTDQIFPVKHFQLVASDYSGSGNIAENEDLDAVEWNDVHLYLKEGLGISLSSGGSAHPITLTVALSGSSGTFFPNTDCTFDLGSLIQRWRNAYFCSAVSVGGTSFMTTSQISAGSSGFQSNAGTAFDSNLFRILITSNTPTIQLRPDGATLKGTIYHDNSNMSIRAIIGALFLGDGVVVPVNDAAQSLGNQTGSRWLSLYTSSIISAGGAFQTNASTSIFQDIQITALFPDLTDVRNIGSATKKFQHGFFSGTVSSGSVFAASTISAGTYQNIPAADLTNIVSDLIPATDNTYSVGTSAKRWKNGLYAGTVSTGGTSGYMIARAISVGTQGTVAHSLIGEHPGNPPDNHLWLYSKSGDIMVDGAVTPIAFLNPQNDLRFGTNIAPLNDNTWAMSLASRRWTLLHISSSLQLSKTTDSTVKATLSDTGNFSIQAESGNAGEGSITLTASNSGSNNTTIVLTANSGGTSGNILVCDPGAGYVRPVIGGNNAIDLGNAVSDVSAERMWRRIYAATMVSFGGTTSNPGFATNTSAGFALGGSAVGTKGSDFTLTQPRTTVPVWINGSIKYLVLYDSVG